MHNFLDFEKPIAELEGRIEELRHKQSGDGIDVTEEVAKLQGRADKLLRQTYAKLTPWQKTQVARHPDRPGALDHIGRLITDFTPMAGDPGTADDPALVGGLGRFRGYSVVVIGTEKGTGSETRIRRNFGMPGPEGYRKARRLMALADRFALPVITLVDTPGARPGEEAEVHGQSAAIARCIEACLDLRVPLISVIIGEGGSGGAVALAVGNTVMMMEHAIYTVASPERCAQALWRDPDQTRTAAEALKLTAQSLLDLGAIDQIIAEPMGGAHRDPGQAVAAVGAAVEQALRNLMAIDGGRLKALRREKFLEMGRQGLE